MAHAHGLTCPLLLPLLVSGGAGLPFLPSPRQRWSWGHSGHGLDYGLARLAPLVACWDEEGEVRWVLERGELAAMEFLTEEDEAQGRSAR